MSGITLGILGGGQLGRMSAQAAQMLDIKTVIYTPENNSPASAVAEKTIVAAYKDREALNAFAGDVDFISYEFENIPVETIEYLTALKPVFPDAALLNVTQDRLKEKQFLNDAGIETTRWAAITTAQDVKDFLANINAEECIIKTARFGYDGKGQARIQNEQDINDTLAQYEGQSLIAEEIIDFRCEASVIIARDIDGNMECYGPVLNEHKNHILDKTTAPGPFDDELKADLIKVTQKIATSINLRGVLALEVFITQDDSILANEIAPRTHNSGHWTIDACKVSQFENHVRCVCGLPVARPEQHSAATMINLIGDDALDVDKYKNQANVSVHLYGKDEIKPGRKMGHVTLLEKK